MGNGRVRSHLNGDLVWMETRGFVEATKNKVQSKFKIELKNKNSNPATKVAGLIGCSWAML